MKRKSTVVSVLGTRPEIIKFSPLLPLLDRHCRHLLLHTGQHYDPAMDVNFFRELGLRQPSRNLRVGSGSACRQIGKMVEGLGKIFASERPKTVLVLGDTNSALAGALAAAKCGARLVHIEAGCRSFRASSPEEQNRKLIDHISDLLLAPDARALANLRREGLKNAVLTGSTVLEAALRALSLRSGAAKNPASPFALLTLHREENTKDRLTLRSRMAMINRLPTGVQVIFPLHPRTKKLLKEWRIPLPPNVRPISPLGYRDFLEKMREAEFVLTDSGGVQEEAALAGTPCLVLRDETEWLAYVKAGRNFLVGSKGEKLPSALAKVAKARDFSRKNPIKPKPAAQKIILLLKKQRYL